VRDRERQTDRQRGGERDRQRERERGFPGFPKIVSVFPRKVSGFREYFFENKISVSKFGRKK
jgi:hypothetical protein